MAITKNDLKNVLKSYHSKVTGLLSNKVDKVSGKDLSTNDYTTVEKNKLAGIANGAQANQNAFSTIKVGTTNIDADSSTDIFEIVAGSNVTITPDATYDKITISSVNTTYSNATASTAGLMSTTDKSKLDGVETGANNYVHPDTASIRHVTDTEKATWNAKETTTGAQSKADTALTSAKSYTDTKVASLVSSAPETLDTLNELATALGNDPNFATTVATQIGTKVDKAEGMGLSSNDYTSTEKTKLAGIATGANNYVHPTTSGNKHIPTGGLANQILRWTSDGTAVWSSENNTTYSAATTTVAGLMSSTDKVKLDGISTGANKVLNSGTNGAITIDGVSATVYTHPTGDANLHVPATSTTNSGKVLTAGSTAGSLSWTALPTSLPANGGNSDTVDGKHATDFATSSHTHGDIYYTETEIDAKFTALNVDLTEEEITALMVEILA